MKVLERSDGLASHLTKWARSIQQRNEQLIMIEAVAKQFEKKKYIVTICLSATVLSSSWKMQHLPVYKIPFSWNEEYIV